MTDERFYIENDAYGETTIWRIGAGRDDEDAPVLRSSDVKDVDLWLLICSAVSGS